jgi:hypothetical protein
MIPGPKLHHVQTQCEAPKALFCNGMWGGGANCGRLTPTAFSGCTLWLENAKIFTCSEI